MQRQSERTIVNKILRYLRDIPECHAYKRYGGRHNPSEPDISGCLRGRRFEIEVKAPGRLPTPGQRAALRRWARAGALTGVAYGIDDVARILHIPRRKNGEEEIEGNQN